MLHKGNIVILMNNITTYSMYMLSQHCTRCGQQLETVPHLLCNMDLLIHYNICTKTKCTSFSQTSWPKVWETLLNIWTNYVCPIQPFLFFSNGHDFAHYGPFGQNTIIRSLIETNYMKLASLSNPLGNL